MLALADAIIVTSESISMITEACAAGKPIFMFAVGGGPIPQCGRCPRSTEGGPGCRAGG
jgi:hypothetical protein